MRSATMTERGTLHFLIVGMTWRRNSSINGTRRHLRDAHDVYTDTPDNTELVGLHLDAHGVPRDVAVHPNWRRVLRRDFRGIPNVGFFARTVR